jgi:glycine/D-amino acid oxidase-like deaminating enzyme
MAPRPDPVVSDETFPERAGVVVIGGGIIGACTALELAERGIDVVLYEKGEVGAEQSSRNWGWCRQMGRDPREIPLAIEALRLWRGMNERVGAETGFRQCGIAYLCETDQDVASRARWLEHAQPYQLDSRLLSGAEAGKLVPGASIEWRGALYTPSDGRAEPQKAAPAIANAARAHGARIFPRCAVRGLELSAGKVSGVVTERGIVACDSVVLAGGAWSRRFCGNLGIHLPQLSVVNSVQRTAPLAGGPEVSAAGDKFAFRKRLDGGYTISHRLLSVADIVPDSFALFFSFLPALRADRAACACGSAGASSRKSGWRGAGRSIERRPSSRCAFSIPNPPPRSWTRLSTASGAPIRSLPLPRWPSAGPAASMSRPMPCR